MTQMTHTETDPRVIQAEAYVRSRFYPPLPHEYGRLAVEAVDAVNEGNPEHRLDVSGLNPQPRQTDEDGTVRADALVEILRLEHLIEQTCPACGGSGWDDTVDKRYVHQVEEMACGTCDGTGVV